MARTDATLGHVMITQDFQAIHWDWTKPDELQALQSKDVGLIGKIILDKLEAAGMVVEDFYGVRHDKDVHEVWSEVDKMMIVDYKTDHGHWVTHFAKGKGGTVAEIAVAVGLEPQFIEKPKRGRYSYENMVAYLTHVKYDDKDKHNYDPHEVVTLRGCDYMTYYMQHLDSWQKAKATMKVKKVKADIDWLEAEILEGRIGKSQVMLTNEYYEIYARNKRRCEDAFSTWGERKAYRAIRAIDNGEFKISVFFITGKSHSGKSMFTDNLVKNIKKKAKEETGEDWTDCSVASKNPLDDYTGDEIIIMDDLRGISMTASDWLKLLDPDRASMMSARYNNKRVASRVIIINSEKDVLEFFYYMKGAGSALEEAMDQFLRRIMCRVVVYRVPNADFRRVTISNMQETENAMVKSLGYDKYTHEHNSVTVHHDYLEAPNTNNMDYDDAIEYLTTVVGINNGWCSKDSLIEIGHTLETPICDMSSEWVISTISSLEKEVGELEYRVCEHSRAEQPEIYKKIEAYHQQIAALNAEMVSRCEEGEEPDFAEFGLDLKPVESGEN
ncbi:MAG: hypothetical protein LUD18_14340 [Lachnospiraceae bacterium]|nr:hypothetical protein [Lachnospiraceae bacterium]